MEELVKILKNIKPEVDFENCKELVDKGLLDSLEIVEIISSIEKTFLIKIDPNEIDPDNFESVESMWEMILQIKRNV